MSRLIYINTFFIDGKLLSIYEINNNRLLIHDYERHHNKINGLYNKHLLVFIILMRNEWSVVKGCKAGLEEIFKNRK